MAEPLVVVAAALIRDATAPIRDATAPSGASAVLTAQRSYPPELAGRWELPGGKVQPGESEVVALQRECREELAVDVAVHERVGDDLPTAGAQGVLRVYRCTLLAGEPQALEHCALQWLTARQLTDVDWLETDRPLVPWLQRLLA